jgi:hypothetical protein
VPEVAKSTASRFVTRSTGAITEVLVGTLISPQVEAVTGIGTTGIVLALLICGLGIVKVIGQYFFNLFYTPKGLKSF